MKIVIFEKQYKTEYNRVYAVGERVPARNFISSLLDKLLEHEYVKIEEVVQTFSASNEELKKTEDNQVKKAGRPKKQ